MKQPSKEKEEQYRREFNKGSFSKASYPAPRYSQNKNCDGRAKVHLTSHGG